ncbi:MAG: hypothetical protein AAFQ45_13755 [Pseudomonadota bacterium]
MADSTPIKITEISSEPKRQRSGPDDLPDPVDSLPGIVIYSHSSLFYWWPVWLLGFILAAVSYAFGAAFATDDGRIEWIHPNSGVGVTFIIVLVLVIIFTNISLRGIYSVALIFAIATLLLLLAYLGVLDDVMAAIPELSIFMSAGFYLTFSLLLFSIWAVAFFFFDRLTYWRIRPGQMTQEAWVGGGEKSYDVRGMLFEKHGEDYFRHNVLGLGSGDLMLKTAGANKATINVPNVLFVDKKVRQIQRLIAVKPDDLMPQ